MHSTITRASVHQHAYQLLQSCLRVRDFSPTCTARVLWHVAFAACARLCALASACRCLATAPSRGPSAKAGWPGCPPATNCSAASTTP